MWSLSDSLLGAAVGASFLYGAAAIYLRARGVEGMGFGDVKLMALIGAFLGTKLTVFTIFAASLAGSMFGLSTVLAVWMKRTRRFEARGTAFGHFLERGSAARLAIGAPGAPLLRDAVWRVSRQHGDFVVPLWKPAPAVVLEGAVRLLANPHGESHDTAHGPASRRSHRSFRVGLIPDPAPAEESLSGIRIAESSSVGGGGVARARLSRRHSATEAAET